MLDALNDLIRSFSKPQDESAYLAAMFLINESYGERSMEVFSDEMNHENGKYFHGNVQELVELIVEQTKEKT